MNRTTELIICIWLIIVVSILVCYPSNAAFSAHRSGTTSGFTTLNNDAYWADGDNISNVWGTNTGQYNEGAAGQQVVAGPGRTVVDVTTDLSSQYSQQSSIQSQAPFNAWDTLYTNNIIPNESELVCDGGTPAYGETTTSGATPDQQEAYGQTGATGTGRYDSSKYDEGSTFAQSAKYQGNGTLYGDLFADAQSGTDKDSDTLNYQNWVRDHNLWAGDKTAALIDWSWDDFSDPFNITANETENQTVEEA